MERKVERIGDKGGYDRAVDDRVDRPALEFSSLQSAKERLLPQSLRSEILDARVGEGGRPNWHAPETNQGRRSTARTPARSRLQQSNTCEE